MLQADFTQPLMGVKILVGTFYKGFKLVLNSAGVVAIVDAGRTYDPAFRHSAQRA